MSVIILLRQEAFVVQLVRASHRYREVTGWKPVEVLNILHCGFEIFN